MTDTLDTSALARWRANPVEFISEVLRNPYTGQRYELLDAERAFFAQCWRMTADGRLLFSDQCYSCPKKSGKTEVAGMTVLTTTLVLGGRYAEGYCVANDLEQAQGRVFQAIRRIVEAWPLLQREADITQSRISFPQTGAVIQAIGSDYASAAGAQPSISSFDELWGSTSERQHRLWDEMVPVPTRKISCRLVTTYAGFEGESTLLEGIYKRGMQQPLIGDDLRAGDGCLFFWSHKPIAPWQDDIWLADMRRQLRPNQFLRMIENRFVTSEGVFVDLAKWDRIVDPRLGAVLNDPALPVYIGVDASTKHDQTAIVAVCFDQAAQQVRLVFHRIFQPTPDEPLDFEATIERTLCELRERFAVCKILFDPWQMQAVSQRLLNQGLPIEEFPQSPANLTAASQNLYELIEAQNLVVYPSEAMRLAISRAIAVETPRGWRISKQTQSHKIDVIIALAMACLAAIRGGAEDFYDYSGNWISGAPDQAQPRSAYAQQLDSYLTGMINAANTPRFNGRRW